MPKTMKQMLAEHPPGTPSMVPEKTPHLAPRVTPKQLSVSQIKGNKMNTNTAAVRGESIRLRLNSMGMTFEEALTAPKKPQGRPRKEIINA